MLFFGRQPGFPSYSAARKRAGPHPAVAPKVALPVGGRLPFWRLRGSFVNPCRASWPFILFGMGRGSPLAAFTKVLITLNRCRFFLSWPAPPMEPAAGADLPPKGRVRGGDLGSHRSAQGLSARSTNNAGKDLSDIWYCTVEAWSESQADKHYKLLLNACSIIAKKPRTGNY